MSMSISPSGRGKSWVFGLTVLTTILGMLLALSLKTQRQAASEGSTGRSWAVRTEYRSIKEENDKLRKDLAFYKSRQEQMAREQAAGQSTSKGLVQALDDAQMLAGLVAVRGPGVVVTLSDSPKKDPAETRQDIIEQYMVHDSDVLAVVNELFSAGAEAISINGERLIANSSIRCAGSPVMINSKKFQSPFVIDAIGNPSDLEKALELQGGVADGLFVLDMLKIQKQANVFVPAYGGSTRFTFAKPLPRK